MKQQKEKQKSTTPRFADPSRGEWEQNSMETKTPLYPPLSGGSKRIAILHDAFLYRGGGERLVTLMAKSLGADLISGFFSEGSFDPRVLGFEGRMIALGKPFFAKGMRHEVLKYRFERKTKFLSEYDTVILSGNCLDAIENIPKTTRKIYYCHTPPRYIFDLRDEYLQKVPRIFHPVIHFFLDRKADRYRKQLAQMDIIITNSKNVQKRLKDFTGYDSQIIYPPTDTSRFAPSDCHREERSDPEKQKEIPNSDWIAMLRSQWQEPSNHPTIQPSNYFLSFARLSPPKRVDLIVEAFLQMPDQNLIFCYGKNDPMKETILKKIEWKKNIIALESPNDTDLISLIQQATATIYIPVDEDFGMSPVESMACGTPVIGVDEWGLRETVIDGITGVLIWGMRYEVWRIDSGLPIEKVNLSEAKREITLGWKGTQGDLVSELKAIIQNTPKEEWVSMRDACILRAQEFSLDSFEKKLKSVLSSI